MLADRAARETVVHPMSVTGLRHSIDEDKMPANSGIADCKGRSVFGRSIPGPRSFEIRKLNDYYHAWLPGSFYRLNGPVTSEVATAISRY